MRRVPQPPVNPASRDVEAHDFWPGFIVVVIGALLIAGGARRTTAVETVDGGTAREVELMKAFASGGLQYPKHQPPPPPPKMDDSAVGSDALDRWARDTAKPAQVTWKVRVDPGAKTPVLRE
jgi:hypothetical protein